jgi:signal transduction histidine kinase
MISSRDETTEALLDVSHEALLALDADRRVTYANDAARRLLAAQAGDVLGANFETLLPASGRRSIRTILNDRRGRTETTVGRTRVELEVRPHADGSLVRIGQRDSSAVSNATPLRQFMMRFPYGIVTIRDSGIVSFTNPLAKRLFAHGDLRTGRPVPEPWPTVSVNALLERARRTHAAATDHVELDGKTLRVVAVPPVVDDEAVLLIEDVTREYKRDRAYGEFVRNAAHQMRTPATAIASTVEILQSGAKEIPAQRDRFLAHIERESARLVRLIKAMLVLARAQAGVQPPRLEFVPLRPLLEDAVSLVGDDPDNRIDVECDAHLAVFVERDLAEQAFQAILENAVRHGDKHVSVRAAEGEDGRVVVTIADTGAGILPEMLERVQEPFYRASVDTEGFGLGLAIASQAIAAIGGTLTLSSTPRQGTEAFIDLQTARIRGG